MDLEFNGQGGFLDIINENLKTGMVVAEVGVLHGSSSVPASRIVNSVNGTYIAIDWFIGCKTENQFYDNELDYYKQILEEQGCLDFIKIIAKSSDDALLEIEDNSLDICWIDADHGYNYTKNDILNYLPKVKDGGILCGHDLELHFRHLLNEIPEEEFYMDTCSKGFHAGVMRAVDEVFGLDNVRSHSSTVWSIIK